MIDLDKPLSFKFSNLKCFNLFCYNFAQKDGDRKNSINQNTIANQRNPIDDKIFKPAEFNSENS